MFGLMNIHVKRVVVGLVFMLLSALLGLALQVFLFPFWFMAKTGMMFFVALYTVVAFLAASYALGALVLWVGKLFD